MKILIVYASAGVGHQRAAEAVYNAYITCHPQDEVVCLDMLDKCNWFMRKAYPGLYIFAVRHLSWLWALLFYATDNRLFYNLTKKLKLLIETANCPGFRRYLKTENFDVIISTHFYSSAMAGELKRKAEITSRLLTIVTDYRVHSYWLTSETDKFAVGSFQTKEDLIKSGIDPEKIEITGIPVDLKFSNIKNKEAIAAKLKLSPKTLRVLLMGGGFGVGPYEYLLENLAVFKEDLSLIVVCGRNEQLLEKLKNMSRKMEFNVDLLGYADNVDELMQVSDLIITKAGAITLNECLVSGLPAVVIRPIPGQEEGNTNYLAARGAVVSKRTPRQIVDFISLVLRQKDILTKMKQNALREARPQAARKVVEIAKKLK